MTLARVLVVDGDLAAREEVGLALSGYEFEVRGVATAWEAMRELERTRYDCVLVEVSLPEIDGVELVRTICHRYPNLLPILTAARPTIESAAAAVRVGAFDYLLKPMDTVRVRQVIIEAVEAKRLLEHQPSTFDDAYGYADAAHG